MENLEALAPGRIAEFLRGSAEIKFAGQTRTERYAWMQAMLSEQRYFSLNKKERGAVRALLSKVAGLSLPQITRLIRSYKRDGEIRPHTGGRRRFPTKYTTQDLELLIAVDRAHQRLSGPATRRILEREWQVFSKREYAGLAEISVAHLYNLRHSAGYRQRAAEFSSTKPATSTIGERRRPDPQGAPGYLRVDTVHQGDWEGEKGVYHTSMRWMRSPSGRSSAARPASANGICCRCWKRCYTSSRSALRAFTPTTVRSSTSWPGC